MSACSGAGRVCEQSPHLALSALAERTEEHGCIFEPDAGGSHGTIQWSPPLLPFQAVKGERLSLRQAVEKKRRSGQQQRSLGCASRGEAGNTRRESQARVA